MQQHIKGLYTMTKCVLFPECKNDSTYENLISGIHQINRIKGEKTPTYALLSRYRKNIFPMSTLIHDKNNQLWMEEKFLNMLKAIHERHTANIIFNYERLKLHPQDQNQHRCLHLPFILNILDVLDTVTW